MVAKPALDDGGSCSVVSFIVEVAAALRIARKPILDDVGPAVAELLVVVPLQLLLVLLLLLLVVLLQLLQEQRMTLMLLLLQQQCCLLLLLKQ